MVWGQELDLTFEEKPATAEELREVHRNKTGMLINAAAQLGAVAASADDIQRQAIARYALSLIHILAKDGKRWTLFIMLRHSCPVQSRRR